MRALIFLAVLIVFSIQAHSGCEDHDRKVASSGEAKKSFGKPITLAESIELNSAINSFDKHQGKDILVRGKVNKVCKKKGCWMQVESANGDVRVTFRDYAFFVPADLMGKTVELEGRLIRKKVSKSEAQHYLEDAGMSSKEAAKKAQAGRKFRFVAAGVRTI